VIPGQVVPASSPISVENGRRTASVEVLNTSVWPVTVTSHFHFFEVNRNLRFDREAAFGMRLDVLAGGSVRWEPGQTRTVGLVEYAGSRSVFGFNGLVDACLAEQADLPRLRSDALARLRAAGYSDSSA
jgi:urease beta subunit